MPIRAVTTTGLADGGGDSPSPVDWRWCSHGGDVTTERGQMASRGRNRGNAPLAVMLVMAALFTVAAGLGHLRGGWQFPQWLTGSGKPVALSASRPTMLEIPALGVRTEVSPVGLDADGSIAAPPLDRAFETGWYSDSPSPGQVGSAIIVGHVDDLRAGCLPQSRVAARDRIG